jgi:hypothetical protein
MMSVDPYKPLWPETTVFIGGGSTVSMGMPTTNQQGHFFSELAKTKNSIERKDFLDSSKNSFFGKARNSLGDLLDLLADDHDSPKLARLSKRQEGVLERLYPDIDVDSRREICVSLRRYYSWDALRRVIRSVPDCEIYGDFLRDLFNLLDMHIQSNSGLPVTGTDDEFAGDANHTEGRFLQCETLRSARDCLILLTNLMFAAAYQEMRQTPEKYEDYVEATRAYARMMQTEGLGLHLHYALNDRRYYLHTAAMVSMNFEPLFLSLLLSANDEVNKQPVWVTTDGVAEPLRIALDLGHLWCVRPVTSDGKKSAGMWYPFNESVAQRLNDPKHRSERRVRIGKFYFPHGSSNTRLCPNCGKSSLHLGESWRFPAETLFPPSVIKGLDWNNSPRSENEKKWREERGHYDSMQCFYCGERTGARDNPMVMQTSFKGGYAPFITEAHNEIRALLEKTRHIVLFGYSLPKDDVIWRSFLAARRKGRDLFCSVVVGNNSKINRWLLGDDLQDYINSKEEHGRDTILSAREVFGEDNVRAYVGGIPSIFKLTGDYQESMRQLLYPDNWGPCFPRNWWEIRLKGDESLAVQRNKPI